MEIERQLVAGLPADVRDEAARHMAAGDYGSLADLLDEYLAAGRPPHPDALLCVAWARAWWAGEVMVDRVVPAAEQALENVAAARRAGAASGLADRVERPIRALLDGERARMLAERAAEDTSAAGPGLSADQLRDRAHRAWDAGRPDKAAPLFQDAARKLRAGGGSGEFGAEIRAALCLAQAGQDDEARPVLERALVYDWAAAGIGDDERMSEHAAMALLRPAARAGVEEFRRTWARAVACAERLGRAFPAIHPFQAELLDLTVGLGLPDHCRAILTQIRNRSSRLDATTRAKVDAAEAYLATGT